MPLPAGTHLGAYEVLAKLGEGGMGEVYRAHDSRLGRDVALKVLPGGLASDAARIDRFRREARAVAALTHPNIVTIYSVEEAGGVHFLTMELVDGETLERQLFSTGISLVRLLDIGEALADALAAAHDKGIVHRDLKPANVMIDGSGRVKVLDFGLAKTTTAPGADLETMARTSEGVVLGTVPYMSPEQVEGKPVDQRSDIFSLGVLLYQAATGKRPFQGASQAALLSSILRDPPAPIADRRPDLPGEFGRLISRCLEKDRERRVQTAKDVRNELEAIRRDLTAGRRGAGAPVPAAAPSPGSDRHSIVVLPFANLSPDPENEYFSDGLTEEIIADLSKVKALQVISRTSSMQLKGTKKDIRTIARELNVQYVLDGSVRKAGTSLRITAQLIDAATDAPLWSDKYAGTIDDVFEVQERVSREIVRALDIRLTSDEHRRLAARPIANARAFELFLQARQEIRRYAPDRALGFVHEAMRIEGETPPLLALQTWTKVLQVRSGRNRDRTPLEEAEREARALLARSPDAAFGYSLLGHIEYERGNLPASVRQLQLALDREPNDSDAMMQLTITLSAANQAQSALDVGVRMIACDPLSPMSWIARSFPHWFVGRPADAIPYARKALAIDPQNFIGHWALGYTYALVGQLADAQAHGSAIHDLGADVPYTRQLLALSDALDGRSAAALARLADIDPAPLDAHIQFHLAEAFIAAGDFDRGLDLLELSSTGFYPYAYYAEYCRFLDPVRHLGRFHAVLAAVKTRAEAFA